MQEIVISENSLPEVIPCSELVPAAQVRRRTRISEPGGVPRHHPAGERHRRRGFARGGSEGGRRRHALEHEGPGAILHSRQINNTSLATIAS
jgi:hypothetical protein